MNLSVFLQTFDSLKHIVHVHWGDVNETLQTYMYISVKADSFIHDSAFISMCRVIQSCFKNYQKLDFAILHSKYTYLGHFY